MNGACGVVNGKLRQPLGQWLQSVSKHRRHHFAYQHGSVIWIRSSIDPQEYQEYQVRPQPDCFQDCQRTILIGQLPEVAQPVEVSHNQDVDGWYLSHSGHPIIPLCAPPIDMPATFVEFIYTLDEWERELLQWVDLRMDAFEFCIDL